MKNSNVDVLFVELTQINWMTKTLAQEFKSNSWAKVTSEPKRRIKNLLNLIILFYLFYLNMNINTSTKPVSPKTHLGKILTDFSRSGSPIKKGITEASINIIRPFTVKKTKKKAEEQLKQEHNQLQSFLMGEGTKKKLIDVKIDVKQFQMVIMNMYIFNVHLYEPLLRFFDKFIKELKEYIHNNKCIDKKYLSQIFTVTNIKDLPNTIIDNKFIFDCNGHLRRSSSFLRLGGAISYYDSDSEDSYDSVSEDSDSEDSEYDSDSEEDSYDSEDSEDSYDSDSEEGSEYSEDSEYSEYSRVEDSDSI